MLVDTHCHLTSERLRDDTETVLRNAAENGIGWLVTIGSNIVDARAALGIAERHENVFAAAGLHPHNADEGSEEAWSDLRTLAKHEKVVAIGETGLDYHYDNAPRDVQMAAFRQQLQIAGEAALPVVVHAREADDDVAKILKEAGWGRGVLHCFSSGEGLMNTALDLGWFISFAGMVTFKNWDQGDLLRSVPDDRILIETDSPYLAPTPHRGSRNEPAFVRHVAEKVAELRGVSVEEIERITTANAESFYGVSR